MRVLHLTPVMNMGHGVSEVIAAIWRQWSASGIYTAVGCQGFDGHFEHVPTFEVQPNADSVAELAIRLDCRVVVAHGSPFFEMLPGLPSWFTTVAYEHGDPTPEMFPDDGEARRAIVEHKRSAVYPRVSGVVAISEFIRQDIAWPAAVVIRSGVDHIPDEGTKLQVPRATAPQPLRVGTLMRLGAGEANYKGTVLLPRIRAEVERAAAGDVQFEVMGRGTEQDADRFRSQGMGVHLNASDEERSRFLREIDVFISPSLWEGMNLPLVEAQALGTPGLAFDTGAHPEFTPLVFDSIDSLSAQIARYSVDRQLLIDHGRMCYHYVRDNLAWSRTAGELATHLGQLLAADAGQAAAKPLVPRQPLAPRVRRRLGRYKAAAKRRLVAFRERQAANR